MGTTNIEWDISNTDGYWWDDSTYQPDTISYEFLQCPQCGTLNYGWYKHCHECGTQLLTQPEPTLTDIMNTLKQILNQLKKLQTTKTNT